MKLIHVSIPEYQKGPDLNLNSIAKQIDKSLTNNFNNQKIVLRAISSANHVITKEKLIEIIKNSGTDRYDPALSGDRYENIGNKSIDFFGRTLEVKPNKKMSIFVLKGFHIYGAQFHKRESEKMDIWLVYDRTKLKSVLHYYERNKGGKRDGYIFKNQADKLLALLGVIVIE